MESSLSAATLETRRGLRRRWLSDAIIAGFVAIGASTGALITDVREVEEGVPVPAAEPREVREEPGRAAPRRPTGRPGGRPGQRKPLGGRS